MMNRNTYAVKFCLLDWRCSLMMVGWSWYDDVIDGFVLTVTHHICFGPFHVLIVTDNKP